MFSEESLSKWFKTATDSRVKSVGTMDFMYGIMTVLILIAMLLMNSMIYLRQLATGKWTET